MEYKGPNEKFSFIQDWVTTLSGSTIGASVWTVPTGPGELVIEAEANDTQTCTLTVSAGTVGTTYKITNTITANNGDEFERDWFLRVRRAQAG